MSLTNNEIIEKIVNRAESLGIPLLSFIEKPTEFYVHGGVTGFSFQPKDYDSFKSMVNNAINHLKMGNDFSAGAVGAVMGFMARREGYKISAREFSTTSSLHLELSKFKCDAHIDSHGITPEQNTEVPLWANQYDPTRLFSHGLNDLLPSVLGDNIVNPFFQHLSIDLRLQGHDLVLDSNNSSLTNLPIEQNKAKNQIIFTVSVDI